MKNISVESNLTIKEAMKALDKTAEKCLLVVDQENTLKGTLTDGDIRRAILKGTDFSETITNCFNSNPTSIRKIDYSDKIAKQILSNKNLALLPILDSRNKVVDYITWSNITGKTESEALLNDVPVVVMAGGKGTRMQPFTKILPKPLVPVHDKPIIEHIIERFTKIGCHEFYLTVNYKSRILKAYFEELQPEYKISFIDEKEPLGTAGSLRYLDGELRRPFFVTNCDIIIKADFKSIYDFHIENNFDLTLVASTKEYVIPYGTCELNEEGHLSHINEKPKYNFLINTGLYILDPSIFKLIPHNKFYHITHLIEDAKNLGKNVGVFPVNDEAWIDVGQWAEYKKAAKNL
jgi:dTDP-glucose pyrophosphorylase